MDIVDFFREKGKIKKTEGMRRTVKRENNDRSIIFVQLVSGGKEKKRYL